MPSQSSNLSAEKYIIKGGLYLYNNIANVSVSDITISGKNNNYYCVSVYNSTSTEIDKCIFENSNYTYAKAVEADMNSMVNIKNCKINDMYNGFYASQNSKSAVYNCNGTVKIGYEATTGGLIQVGMTSGNALNCSTSEAKTSYGGKVFIGSASGNKEY